MEIADWLIQGWKIELIEVNCKLCIESCIITPSVCTITNRATSELVPPRSVKIDKSLKRRCLSRSIEPKILQMDLIANIITVASAAANVAQRLHKLADLRHVPEQILLLENEVRLLPVFLFRKLSNKSLLGIGFSMHSLNCRRDRPSAKAHFYV